MLNGVLEEFACFVSFLAFITCPNDQLSLSHFKLFSNIRSLCKFGFCELYLWQSSHGLLALPQENLPALGSSICVVHRHPNAGSLESNSYVSNGCRRLSHKKKKIVK